MNEQKQVCGKTRNNKNSKNSKFSGRKNQKKAAACERPNEGVSFTESKDRPNDVSWYAANPQLLADAASLSFGNPLGITYTLRATQDIGSTELKDYDFAAPGLMSMNVALCPGYANTWTDPVNIAARNLYSFVRHANSGHSNYDAPDLMNYLLAADSVYSMWAFLVRTYGLLRAYSIYNRYWPRAVVESAGLDFDDLSANMADFRYQINQFAVKASSLCVPKDLTMFARHTWLFSNVYLDDPGVKGQTFVFNPAYFYKYTITVNNVTLEPQLLQNKEGLTYKNLIDMANDILDAMLVNEDMNIMSGDILKAYGMEKLWRLSSIAEDYIVLPVYNAEVNYQIHNATVFEVSDSDLTGWRISQDMTEGPNRGCLIFKPTVTADAQSVGSLYPCILDMPMDTPTPADVMVATRLAAMGTRTTADATKIQIQIFGTEIVTSCTVWNMSKTGMVNGTKLHSAVTDAVRFNNAPLYKFCMYDSQYPQLMGLREIRGELNNWTVVPAAVLDKMHGTAQLSELSIPQMSKF